MPKRNLVIETENGQTVSLSFHLCNGHNSPCGANMNRTKYSGLLDRFLSKPLTFEIKTGLCWHGWSCLQRDRQAPYPDVTWLTRFTRDIVWRERSSHFFGWWCLTLYIKQKLSCVLFCLHFSKMKTFQLSSVSMAIVFSKSTYLILKTTSDQCFCQLVHIYLNFNQKFLFPYRL